MQAPPRDDWRFGFLSGLQPPPPILSVQRCGETINESLGESGWGGASDAGNGSWAMLSEDARDEAVKGWTRRKEKWSHE